MDDHDKILCERLATTVDHGICKCHERHRIAALKAELADERERREAAEVMLQDAYFAIFEDADVNDVRAQIEAHFARYKD